MEALQSVVRAHDEGHQHVLASMATGFGKTIVAGGVIERFLRDQRRLILLAHRDALLKQAREKIQFVISQHGGDPEQVQICTRQRDAYMAPVAIVSVQTATNWDVGLADRDYLILDEAHHACAPTFSRILDEYTDLNPAGQSLGLTATAYRTDDRSLGDIYTKIAYQVDLATLIREGWLCPLKAKIIELGIDHDGAAMRGGDFDRGQLDRLVNTPAHNRAVVDAIHEYAADRKIILFGVSIHHAQKLAEGLTAVGIPAACLHYKSKNKDQIYADYHAGRLQALTNVDLLTEGFDEPATSCVVSVRETMSPIFYVQSIGRGLRQYPGKENCLLLDFSRNSERHSLCAPPDLVGKPKKALSRSPWDDDGELEENSPDAGVTRTLDGYSISPLSVTDVDLLNSMYAWEQVGDEWVLGLGVGEGSLIIHSQMAQPSQSYLYLLTSDSNLQQRAGPLDLSFCLGVAQEEASRYNTFFSQRTQRWRKQPATLNQLKALRRFGVIQTNITRGRASALLAVSVFKARKRQTERHCATA